jgi:hypothetical protein
MTKHLVGGDYFKQPKAIWGVDVNCNRRASSSSWGRKLKLSYFYL